MEQLLAAVSVALACVLIWHLAFVLFPRCEESRYRYRLWEIRDRLVARILDGTLPLRDRLSWEMVETIEASIRNSDRCHLFFWIGAVAIWRKHGSPSALSLDEGLAQLSDSQKEVVLEALRDYAHATMHHLFKGSIFGLVMLALFAVIGTIGRVKQQLISFGRKTLSLDERALDIKACLSQH